MVDTMQKEKFEVDSDLLDNQLSQFFTIVENDDKEENKNAPFTITSSNRKSKFWFRVVDDIVDRLQEDTSKIDNNQYQELGNLSQQYKQKIPKDMEPHIDKAREFILTEIVPYSFALSAASNQSQVVLSQLFNDEDTQIDFSLFSHLERFSQKALLIKIAIFIQDYFNLPSNTYESLISPKSESNNLEKMMKQIIDMTKNLERV